MKNPNPVSKRLKNASPSPASSEADSKTPKKSTPSSQSNDRREDRGTREIKTSHNPQTFRHLP
jgi:hypothetical protein